MRLAGADKTVLYFPELKLVNILLSFMKLLFLIRIIDTFGFLIQMLIFVLNDLTPFILTYIIFLNFFSVCFIVLDCDIDGEIQNQVPVLSHYEQMLLQVYRTALGELSMPAFSRIMKKYKVRTIFRDINVNLIWLLWVVATFFMFVIMTNFNIAQITNTYNSTVKHEKKIAY